jgi:nucleoside-diphosphate-sugar epimerase
MLTLLVGSAVASTVLVTGATGRTGALTYARLRNTSSLVVRGLVRDAEKAAKVLGCHSCNEDEGIYMGDITREDTLDSAMKGVDVLIITTGPMPVCDHGFTGCNFPKGADPKSIAFDGVKNQVTAFAKALQQSGHTGHVILLSSMLTTEPNNFLDKLGGAHTTFYALQGEVWLMGSGLPFTIVKACGLGDKPGGKRKLVVGHDDKGFSLAVDHMVSRDDVARVLSASATAKEARGLRFDLCSSLLGRPTSDVHEVFVEAEYPWQRTDTDMLI